jgi:UPF0176 protein
MTETQYTIILFYKYTPIKDPVAFMNWNKEIGAKLGLKGRIHIASEGINATVEGLNPQVEIYMEEIRKQQHADLADLKIKTSPGYGEAFPNLKVKVKEEIVALKLKGAVDENGNPEEDVDPRTTTGVHLAPEELKKWFENDEDFVVIDMRNDYEFRVGHFKDSINPGMNNFRDLPKVLPKILENNPEIKKKKVVTVCTGGVRCEKASGYLLKKGFEDVYQLDGGMHMFMEKFPGDKDKGEVSDFKGALYTFDNRVIMDFNGGEPKPEAATNPKKREIVGKCQVCLGPTERFDHCSNDICHLHLLVCDDCAKNHIYVWCSKDCQENGRIGKTPAKDLETRGALITG